MSCSSVFYQKNGEVGSQKLHKVRPSIAKWFCGVMVSTLDSESNDPSSNLGRTFSGFLRDVLEHFLLFSSVYTNDLMRSTFRDCCLPAAYLSFLRAVNVG